MDLYPVFYQKSTLLRVYTNTSTVPIDYLLHSIPHPPVGNTVIRSRTFRNRYSPRKTSKIPRAVLLYGERYFT